ncbi:hypothetical protein MBLNU13_g11682t1 [Cladosporium sp. NU13]
MANENIAYYAYEPVDVNDNGAVNNPLPPDAILTAIQNAMEDAHPEGMPDAPPPSPQPVEPRQVERRFVELVFNGSTGQSVTFKLKDTTKFGKAMDAYSARVQQPVNQLRFLFEGKRLGTEDTPAAHEMEDGDIVDVHMEQLGGGSDDGSADDEGSSDEDLQDWVMVSDVNLLQRTIDEKARLCCLIERLRREIFALKHNNRTLARELNGAKVDKTELEDDYHELYEQFAGLMIEHQSVVITNDREIRALKASIDQKNRSIDAILKDFQFTLD